jgi:hypothetical protein
MIVTLVLAGLMIAGLAWLIVYTLRRPKKPDHEREPERLRDPAITAYKGGPSGSSF